VFFESVDAAPASVGLDAKLTVVGFGCVDLKKMAVEEPPVLRTGRVVTRKSLTPEAPEQHWIETRSAKDGSSFVCPGDSGGPVYRIAATGERKVVAVISGVQDNPQSADYLVSYFAALGSPGWASFVKQWQADNGMPGICGLDAGTPRCRVRTS
jgi:hypothetical protein